MAAIVIEGFDKYGIANNTTFGVAGPPPISQGGWSLVTGFGTVAVAAPLSATGQAMSLIIGSTGVLKMSKTLPANFARLIGGFRFSSQITGLCGITFLDNTTDQFSINVQPTSGFISVNQGLNGTQLQISSAAVAGNTIHYLEYDVTFNASGILGGWTVWLDGVQILNGTGVTAQTANNFANVFQFYSNNGVAGEVFVVDDVYVFDSSGTHNNAVLLSNPDVVTQFATSDNSIALVNQGNVFGFTFSVASDGFFIVANTLYLLPFTPPVNCTINAIVVNVRTASVAAKIKGVIYADNAGIPGTLKSSGTEVVGAVVGDELFPLVTPQALTAGVQYWLGVITDTSFDTVQYSFQNAQGFSASNTYASGAPGTAPGMTSGFHAPVLFGACTGATTNWESEALNPPIGDLSSVASATPGDTDLYGFPNLPTAITTVYAVAVSANCRLSAPGSHTFNTVAKSGGTSGNGSKTNIPPTTSYAWYDSYFEVDPNTGSPWTPAAINNGFYGMTIVT